MAHAAPLRHAPASRSGSTAARALPLLLGLAYGFWVATNAIHGGPVTAGKVLLGVLSGLVLTALVTALHRVGGKLPPGPRALSWAVLTGTALGFLYNQSGRSVLACAVVSLAVAAGTFVMTYYHYCTART
ncbi:hypothetical protein DCW30_10575 [Streptomyces alfalfae]|uniref:Uncharacterized protein n=1 Tax=Streptomyces alfalfae TaxID=1642299 RepID=A0A1P8TI21_9ACTN|nr:hypothetical protein [Streptomyces alfalfae]AYA17683.1 hypothetical protein D3X13_16825 [Streptomyces fradiae]APY87278.1 hypothetical protein A7J05_17470 [Streptomyces alfalfae]QQC90423.1 hypothetical protein I8755_19910 [Streptomyces alfalfae]QUI32896.1 hypothetical protein H9W91_20090 [Streptomyces alfalfae]RXX44894.1 hypothetical protein DCW30_10575 [Streptomyces alfalfae]